MAFVLVAVLDYTLFLEYGVQLLLVLGLAPLE